MKKKLLYGLIGFTTVLIITNPSLEEFQSFMHMPSALNGIRIGREHNFFVFSIYSDETAYADETREGKYMGILGNFIKI